MVRLPSQQPLTLLRILLARYVHHHADEAIRFTVLAVQTLASGLDPADISVLLQQSVFLHIFFPVRDGAVDSFSDPLNVLGMNACEVVRQRGALISFGRIDREHFRKSSIGIEGGGLDIPSES